MYIIIILFKPDAMITNSWSPSSIVYDHSFVNTCSEWSLKCWFYWISGKKLSKNINHNPNHNRVTKLLNGKKISGKRQQYDLNLNLLQRSGTTYQYRHKGQQWFRISGPTEAAVHDKLPSHEY